MQYLHICLLTPWYVTKAWKSYLKLIYYFTGGFLGAGLLNDVMTNSPSPRHWKNVLPCIFHKYFKTEDLTAGILDKLESPGILWAHTVCIQIVHSYDMKCVCNSGAVTGWIRAPNGGGADARTTLIFKSFWPKILHS